MRTFKQAWVDKVKKGYQYGPDALQNVRFGWDIAIEEMKKSKTILESTRRGNKKKKVMKAYTLKNGHILLVPKGTKTVQLPGTLDNLGTDAMEYVKRFREIADTIEKYEKDESSVS